jgi:putative endonuclease
MQKGGWVYILTNKRYGVLYVGVTSNLPARMLQHRQSRGSEFAARYNLTRLVYYEWCPTIEDAIVREKRVKSWKRMWRIELIESMNPAWKDIYDVLNA